MNNAWNQQRKQPQQKKPNLPPVRPSVGGGAVAGVNKQQDKNRKYDKPWLSAANSGEPAKNNGGQDKNSFLYQYYPDGNGPDSELI